METKECVLAIPTAEMLETVVKIGNCSGADTDKFKTFNLKTDKAETVKPPLLSGVLINAECRLIEDGVFDRYNAAVLQITKAWHNPDLKDQRLMHHNGNGIFTLDGERIDSDSRVFVLGNVDSDINHKQKLPCKN